MENPNSITEKVLGPRIDQDGFEILSIDIADAGFGEERRGAALRSSQAAADKEVAQAQAEIKKPPPLLSNRKTRPKSRRCKRSWSRPKQVPMAMAEAFRNGNLGIMDYYRMLKNAEADTEMRTSISKDKE